MRFSAERRLDESDLLVHLHVPRGGGSSLRQLLARVLGEERVLAARDGRLEGTTLAALENIRCISGAVAPGALAVLARTPAWITVLRHPVDRFVSSYASFLADTTSPHHATASRHDINEFLRHVLDSGDAALRNELGNLQCRLVCGEPDHLKARKLIDEEYFLAAPLTEIDDMVRMLLSSLGLPPRALARVGAFEPTGTAAPDRLRLSEASVDALMSLEAEDVLLYSHVQKSFGAVRDVFAPPRARAPAGVASAPAPVIPPDGLRFMGETPDTFISNADYLGDRVLDFVERFKGREPERLLDVGCGYGRLAYGLRRSQFGGSYAGFDILARHIGWLVENFAASDDDRRYRFDHADIYNERYNPGGKKGSELPLAYRPESFDTLVSLSVFTHLYEDDAVRYVRQLAALLEDGGLWVTTFFCLPDAVRWNEAPANAVYPLVAQVSEHAYIHNPAEPLLVIAFDQQFLLRLFAREGLEVVSQRKGRWFNRDDAAELQDWFVLRKRKDWLPLAMLPPSALPVRCNICGSDEFARGPNGRLSLNGRLPRCLACDSLERHRAVRRVFTALPREYLADRRALQFSPDNAVDPTWFRSFEVSIYEGENSLDLQAIERDDASYDFLSSSHVMESVPDDIQAFAEQCRILSPRGLLHISFGLNDERLATIHLAEPAHSWGAHRYYGHDIGQRFDVARRGLRMLEIVASDPCTGTAHTVHLFTRDERDEAWLREQFAKDAALLVR